ncbi:hypothetical protein SNE40_002020 [Patella caerulea]|uniref:Uncharacterized protein n=1 Tax=Patella caerulea TaxID=87958 RepID=A0AAN8PZF4_PATCE
MSLDAMTTIDEREKLIPECQPCYSGFKPRPVEKLATRKKPISVLDIECRNFLRTSSSDFTNGQPSVEQRLWMEAGKCGPPFPQKPDASYNSNVWRNFRKQFGFNTSADGRKISEVIAAMYPLNIPRPSKIGDHSFTKYISESNLFQDEKFKKIAIRRTRADHQELKRLKIKSDGRNPPIDQDGKILPPENFKKYVHRFIPPPGDHDFLSSPLPEELCKPDIFGRRYNTTNRPDYKPHLWKLTYRLNKPEYDAVQTAIRERKERNNGRKTSRAAPSPASL